MRLRAVLVAHAVVVPICDGAMANLEAKTPSNVSRCQCHGFESLGQTTVGDSPSLPPMVRKARRLRRLSKMGVHAGLAKSISVDTVLASHQPSPGKNTASRPRYRDNALLRVTI